MTTRPCHSHPVAVVVGLIVVGLLGLCAVVVVVEGAEGNWWTPGATPLLVWQWQLQDDVQEMDPAVTVMDVDLFDVSAARMQDLRDAAEGGEGVVICYFSAGTYEEWRDDADDFDNDVLGEPLEDWDGERYVDIRAQNVRDIMAARLDEAQQKNCDAVEPDNAQNYLEDSGFSLSKSDQLDFNRWIANQSHARNMSVGLKNALPLIDDLVDDFDWALNEQCWEFDECDDLIPFTNAGKAVLIAMYNDEIDSESKLDDVCDDSEGLNFSTIVKKYSLKAPLCSCADPSVNVDCDSVLSRAASTHTHTHRPGAAVLASVLAAFLSAATLL